MMKYKPMAMNARLDMTPSQTNFAIFS